MKAPALLAYLVASACAHHPSRVAWSDIELGFRTCGARAQLEAVLDRACALTVTANRTAPRTATIAPADCRAVLSLAANRASRSQQRAAALHRRRRDHPRQRSHGLRVLE
jgi:hypothetical protein